MSMRIERDAVLAGRYRVERCLGRGGMGSVWQAVDLRLDRAVAVKTASVSANSYTGAGQARRRLRREAEALAALSEPRIARLYDLVEADGEVCLVMELVAGESLAARLDRQPKLAAREALEIAGQCAQALHAAHRIGIVHRDVKPSNIMLGPDGAKVVDFGIAAHIGPMAGDTTATMSRSVVGTAAYLAPERALGASAGGEADFYSLGVVLYQMLAGYLPFRTDETLAMLYAHARATPEPLPADVPAPAATLCLRMLSKQPEQRPTSPQEFRAASEALSGVRGRVRRRDAFAAASASVPVSATRRIASSAVTGQRRRTGRLNRTGRRVGRRGNAILLTALSGAAAVLAMETAWNLLDQPASAGVVIPAPAPRVVTTPAAAIPSPVSHVSTRPATTTPTPGGSGGRHGKHAGHGGDGNGNGSGSADGGG